MKKNRLEESFIVKIWHEPSELATPGEWRGTVRKLGGSDELLFKSAQELWEYIIQQVSSSQDSDRSKSDDISS